MTRRSAGARALVTLLVALCTAATLLSTSSSQTRLQLTADTTQFNAGNIISDAMFFDPNALTVAQIASFIAAKGANCQVGADGSPCLKNYRESTFTRPADGICDNQYPGAANETAAAIIWKVGQACNVSSKVLLVLLQKEQAFLTTTNPTARKYQIAAGMGCPDTAACDTQYYGFYNQVYSAARQYQRYATYPTKYSYRAGFTNTIQWSPTASCGTSQVYIVNQATAGLYNYTPYRPNSAALRAGYGSGDSCSAYGNRNFWLYFTDWFGSTQSPGGDAILTAYAARGGASGPLGPWTTWVYCGLVGGGCFQAFQNGHLYWSPTTGVAAISEPMWSPWEAQRWETGPLGYPTGDMFCGLKDSGCGQTFQGGHIYTSPATGPHAIPDAMWAPWEAQRWETGPLGYPTSEIFCGLKDSGCGQAFQGGHIYTSPGTGPHAIKGWIHTAWVAQGWETGPLGYPTGDETCGLAGGACKQEFQGGTMYAQVSSGTHAVSEPIATAWAAAGGGGGTFGYPTADQVCGLTNGGCFQVFQNGRFYSSSTTGTHAVAGWIGAAWAEQSRENGPLGYPTGDETCGLAASGCKQVFQGGTLYAQVGSGTHAVSGDIAGAWAALGGEGGSLGYPTTDQSCGLKDGGCKQTFQHGRIYSSSTTGAHAVAGWIGTAWAAQGSENGPLGYPTGDETCGLPGGGCKQVFQGGTLYAQVGSGTHAVSGAVATVFVAAGGEAGPLGYPTSDLFCGLKNGGCGQAFQGGHIYTSPATGTHAIKGWIDNAWVAQRWETGSLGYPIGDELCGLAGGGCKQEFQGGTMYAQVSSGTHAVSGAIATAWAAAGGEGGTLGYPTSDTFAVATGTAQNFQGGRLTLNKTTGQVTRS